MYDGVDHFGADVNTKLANRENPQAVSDQGQRDDRQSQYRPLPGSAQEEMAGQQAGDEQYEAGMNAAAFRGDPDGYARELKHQPVTRERRAGQTKQRERDRRGTLLLKDFNAIHQKPGNGCDENEEAQGKNQSAQMFPAEKQTRGACQER